MTTHAVHNASFKEDRYFHKSIKQAEFGFFCHLQKVPGPGSYEKTYQSPMPATIAKMGRNHGLFFTSAFSV